MISCPKNVLDSDFYIFTTWKTLTRPAEVFELFKAGLIEANELFGLFLLISPSAVLRECLAPTAETRTENGMSFYFQNYLYIP